MGFLSLLEVATMPVLQFLIVGLVGAFLATPRCNILSAEARKYTNEVVFYVFTPAIIFSNLAKTVTVHNLVSWWFMPVNIGFTFLIGTILGWVAVKIVKPEKQIENLVIASCSAGNLGNLMLIIIPAVCNEEGSPFGEASICNAHAFSYASLSMALGGFFIWTHTYGLMKKMSAPIDHMSLPTKIGSQEEGILVHGSQQQMIAPLLSSGALRDNKVNFLKKVKDAIHQLLEELMSPATIAAMIGFIVGVIPWLKSLIIGSRAPLRVIEDSVKLLGDGLVPCMSLILGGNLTKGLRKSSVKVSAVLSVILARYVLLPISGIGVVKAAGALGFLPQDPLFNYALLLQFVLPPAMAIGTMAQLFDSGQEECSVMFLWTYLFAAPALTIWSTIFMYILS